MPCGTVPCSALGIQLYVKCRMPEIKYQTPDGTRRLLLQAGYTRPALNVPFSSSRLPGCLPSPSHGICRSITAENPATTDILGNVLKTHPPNNNILVSLQGVSCVLEHEHNGNQETSTLIKMPPEIRAGIAYPTRELVAKQPVFAANYLMIACLSIALMKCRERELHLTHI